MVAYSFKKQFVPHIEAGLELGPWCPGMKRHTLRSLRSGKTRHARPSEAVQLYTAMRTKQCRPIGSGVGTCQAQMPVELGYIGPKQLSIHRIDPPPLFGDTSLLAPAVLLIANAPHTGCFLDEEAMHSFARTDGFEDADQMQWFFAKNHGFTTGALPLVLIGWSPRSAA